MSCLLCCRISTPPLSYLSYTHLSILGLASLTRLQIPCEHDAHTVFALPCLGPLAPRGAVGARHDGLPRQSSPLLPVVCHGLSISEGFAGPLCDVITPALFGLSIIRLTSTVPCALCYYCALGQPVEASSPSQINQDGLGW